MPTRVLAFSGQTFVISDKYRFVRALTHSTSGFVVYVAVNF
jgi:hypothetical protein